MRPLAGPGLQGEDGVRPVDAVVERCPNEPGDQADRGCQEGDGAVDEGVVPDLIESVSTW